MLAFAETYRAAKLPRTVQATIAWCIIRKCRGDWIQKKFLVISATSGDGVMSNLTFRTLGFCDRASWANCEERERERERKPTRCNNQMFIINFCLNLFRASLCPSSGEQRPCVTACGVLCWFCWMWLVAVVGRCVVGCEQCFTSFTSFTLL